MKTIFMTGGGGCGTIAAAKRLKNTGRYRIILGDMDPWSAGLHFADKSYVLPAGKDPNFIDFIQKIIKKERVNIFIPMVDEEILKSYELEKIFPYLQVILPEYAFAKMALDKFRLMIEFKQNRLSYPKTYLYKDRPKKLKFPCIVKPRIGRGSRNVIEVISEQQLISYKNISGLSEEEILIQEKIIGKEFTVSVVVNKHGRVLAVVPKEVINKRGTTITAITRKNRNIERLCCDIQDKLNANGPFNVQLILKNNNVPVVFEVNPRYSTTIALTMEAGVNEIELLIENKKHKPGLLPFNEDLVMSRFYEQFYFKEHR